jgi:tRNA pseudouridine38-40 synthase
MRRIRVTIAYDGTAYHGWQSQPGLVTIQQTIEDVLAVVEGKPVQIMASGRTDAGVHAHGQVAAFNLHNRIPCDNLRKAVNRLLPHDIRIVDCRVAASESFHPRFDATAKTYEYRLYRGEVCPPMLRRYVAHHPYPLNEAAMNEAARLLEGEHDFRAYAATDPQAGENKVRTIYSSIGESRTAEDLWVYRVRGTGFLKHMVRNIVGVLLQVGQGNVTNEGIAARLQPGCGIPAGPRAAASGLALVSVEYPEDLE